MGDNGLILKTSNGGSTYVGIDNAENLRLSPESCRLNQNYPNPFNPRTTIQYALPAARQTSLLIFDIKGNMIKTLVSKPQTAGWHESSWDGMDNSGHAVATGLYLAKLQSGASTQTIKMLFLK